MERHVASYDIPYAKLRTLFFDAGNTLVSFDLALLRAELLTRGVACEAEPLRRAEAAARPIVSAALSTERSTEAPGTFELYLHEMLSRAPLSPALDSAALRSLARGLAPALDAIGRVRLWSSVMPKVPDMLTAFRERGFQLLVVSNSDGTVEELLATVNLRHYFDAVIDSHIVGYAKPDPRIFHHALRVARAVSETTLHVGDLYHADVVGARSAGLHALLLDPFGDWAGTDCERAADLGDLLDRLSLR